VDYAIDSINNIILYSSTIECIGLEILLPLMNWNGILLDRDVKYICNTRLIVYLMSIQNIPVEAANHIKEVVLDMIEKILSSQVYKDDLIVKYYVRK
jgi:hypothetical protein